MISIETLFIRFIMELVLFVIHFCFFQFLQGHSTLIASVTFFPFYFRVHRASINNFLRFFCLLASA